MQILNKYLLTFTKFEKPDTIVEGSRIEVKESGTKIIYYNNKYDHEKIKAVIPSNILVRLHTEG